MHGLPLQFVLGAATFEEHILEFLPGYVAVHRLMAQIEILVLELPPHFFRDTDCFDLSHVRVVHFRWTNTFEKSRHSSGQMSSSTFERRRAGRATAQAKLHPSAEPDENELRQKKKNNNNKERKAWTTKVERRRDS